MSSIMTQDTMGLANDEDFSQYTYQISNIILVLLLRNINTAFFALKADPAPR
jgi:hypothetical protein